METLPIRDLFVFSLKDRKAQPFDTGEVGASSPSFSPDGRWIAYTSNESGGTEVYVRPYPGPGGKWQISTDGGTEPVWNPKGRELFYRSGQKMMEVDYTEQPEFSAGKPKMLFEGAYMPSPRSLSDYDVTPDGQRFLMLKDCRAVARANQRGAELDGGFETEGYRGKQVMALATAIKLGSYEVLAQIGAGGVSEVCRAGDLRYFFFFR